MIPFHSNSRQHAGLAQDLTQALGAIDLTDDTAFGREIEKFEAQLADYCQVGSAVAVASGTDALIIALRALDAPPGAEVITCDFGFYATAASIIMAGFTPVFVDVAPGRMIMDLDAVRDAISPRTAAIVPVHMFGEAVNMPALEELAAQHSIAIVEDVAQALGARTNGQLVGSFGTASGISFNWSKHLSSFSNGGAVLTNDSEIAARVRSLRGHGNAGGFKHTRMGLNSRLNPFEAALLSTKLPHLDTWIARRREIADRYTRNFASSANVITPAATADEAHVFHKYTVRVPDRDGLRKHLTDQGVGTLVCYPWLLHDQPAFEGHSLRAHSFERASNLAAEVISIPVFPELKDAEIDFVSEAIVSYVESAN
ncbi:DegT/DnrJ/EryC1/StrS aminotransferase family protein [Streptomyces sp. PSKA30]|uniref:DegT/DnrJ/EryC1/StrS family aminotransferase n=1 Tax=Streptomyces sp. PSKA30 TaxID=2874597 RepID=UPI001CD04C2D|nr:DegT/DnrJ/EryC1/StrS family aminotransferase [Streptomyces sp. PSKA30]MBZ9641421.1 DegT/DnrJ/EryC1/StrS family aminotransferase [Streptomyces sp. PSKA30]